MTSTRPEAADPAEVAGCPWCGPGTELKLVGDGMGNVTVCCMTCHCRGPVAPIEGEFDDADLATVGRWSQRATVSPPPDQDALELIRAAVRMHVGMNGHLDETSTIEIPYPLAHRLIADRDG